MSGGARGAGGEREDQYYRELLARVDSAIVETREAGAGGGTLGQAQDCARGCLVRCASGLLVAMAVTAECLSSVRHAAAAALGRDTASVGGAAWSAPARAPQRGPAPPAPAPAPGPGPGPVRGADGGYEL
jgi:hypothetical protein